MAECGRLPLDCRRLPLDCRRLPLDCRRLPLDCRRLPANCRLVVVGLFLLRRWNRWKQVDVCKVSRRCPVTVGLYKVLKKKGNLYKVKLPNLIKVHPKFLLDKL